MNATNAQDLRSRSTQQGRQDPTQSSSNSLNRHRGPPPFVGRTVPPARGLDQHRLSVDFPIQMHREVGRPHPRDDPVRSVDKVFNVYGERIRADLRDMHGLCTQLVTQEKQEAAKWYALCAKVITERDHARQRLNVLAHERNNTASNSSSGGIQHTNSAGRLTSKRGRVVPSYTLESRSDTASTNSTVSMEGRPMRSLRLSPVHSPPASPSPRLSTSPPSSSILTATPLPPSSTRSEFSPCEQRPVKLRRSCDLPNPISYEGGSQTYLGQTRSSPSPPQVIKQQPRTPSPLSLPTHVGDITSNFSHVDLMYVSAKGGFVCRACLLEKSKSPSLEPKAFPFSASWDELRDHCVGLHPEACADVARLQPAEIFELRRRLSGP